MKPQTIAAVVVLAALVMIQNASAVLVTNVINSWENSLEGWTVPPSYNLQDNPGGFGPITVAFSTTRGVTDGTYSLAITGTGTGGANSGAIAIGPSSVGLTTLLGNSDKLLVDVNTSPYGAFGWYGQLQIAINNADTGWQSSSYQGGFVNWDSPSVTLSFAISDSVRNILASSSNPTEIIFQFGSGNSAGNNTLYLDNLRATEAVPEPSTFALWGLGALVFVVRRRMSRT